MSFISSALKYGGGLLGKGRQFITGLRTGGTTATTTAAPATPQPGLINALTRPRSITRPPKLEPTKVSVPVFGRDTSRVVSNVVTGLSTAGRGIDDLLKAAKGRAPKDVVDEIKNLRTSSRGKNPTITKDDALKEAQRKLNSVTEEVVDEAAVARNAAAEADAARNQAIARQLSKLSAAGGAAIGASPQLYSLFNEGEQAPDWLKTAAAASLALPGAKLLGGGLSRIFRGEPGTLRTLGGTALSLLGIAQAKGIANAGAEADAAEATPETPLLPTPETGAPSAVDPLQEVLDNINAQAQVQLEAVDASVGQALEDLIAAYGGDQFFQQALAQNDQMLAMELAAIEADANAARAQIGANYDAAISQIEGYSTQASDVLSQAAAEQQGYLETAAGGLQGMQVAPGMAAGEAAASGISGTAVGGAGVTGAAVLRAQGAAGASQAAADKARVVTTLSDQAATGRMNEADMLAALERGIIDAKQATRIDSANNKAKLREAEIESKRQLAEIKYNAQVQAQDSRAKIEAARLAQELQFRQVYAQLTPEQRAAFTGGSQPVTQMPSWATERGGDQNANISKVAKVPVTLRERNSLVATLVSYAQQGGAQATDPNQSLAYWTTVLRELTSKEVDPAAQRKLEALGLPSTAFQLAQAFSTTR